MKKIIFAMVTAALVLLGCPTVTEDNDKKPSLEKPELTKSGMYLENTKIEMSTEDYSLIIFYTLDGTAPDPDMEKAGNTSKEYSIGAKPVMLFESDDTVIKVRAIAVTEDYTRSSEIVEAEYTQFKLDDSMVSAKMKTLMTEIAAMPGGLSAASPLYLKLDSGISIDDVKMQFPNPENPNSKIEDGLGGLFLAFGEKFIDLDLSDTNWDKIPACHTNAFEKRLNRDKLVKIKFPASLTSVEPYAFRAVGGLKKADFTGCSLMTIIEEYSFSECINLELLILDGCSSLESIGQYAFNRCENLQYADFSQTALKQIRNNAFQNNARLKYIEFPETLESCADYSFQRAYSLDYVRYRNEKFRPYFGWAYLLYYMDANDTANWVNTYTGLPAIYRVRQPENTTREATGKNFVIFHPDVPYFTSGSDNLFYTNSGASYHHGQHVALPKKSDPDYARFDSLRGDDLLRAQELHRGLSNLTLNIEGLKDAAGNSVNGTITARAVTVRGRVNGYLPADIVPTSLSVTGPITDGNGAISIGEPSSGDLQVLDNLSGQALTGRYDRTHQDPLIKWNKTLGENTVAYDHWTVNGNEGYDGEPQPWPRGVKFAILDLELKDAGGNVIGYPQRSGIGKWFDLGNDRANTKVIDQRTIRYVYVSDNVSVYRRERRGQDGICNVFITLKKGWNLWEVTEWWRGDWQNGQNWQTGPEPVVDPDKQHAIINMISSGKVPNQDWSKDNDDTGWSPGPTGAPGNPLQFNEIPWVLNTSPWKYPD
ncbi:hypothetical protein AGMMS4952_17960 [Spirochaetia bacterium]|nr:hypothetical protein AGMMS4952_17960 [Spirochaetia bacterium]